MSGKGSSNWRSTRGHRVRALTRRPQEPREGVDWIDGSLEDRDALERLVTASDAVIHVAGIISAPDAAGFETGNVAGTLAMLAAATAAGTQRFVHVSSLAAREPALSLYGASKARSEELVRSSGLNWVIVRPPAVYGPGDKETLELFKMAKAGLILLPPKGRLSLIHVDDLARLLLDSCGKRSAEEGSARTRRRPPRRLDAPRIRRRSRPSGRPARVALQTPGPLLRAGAALDRLVRRDKAKLTPDRAAYFCHPDWVVSSSGAPSGDIWAPQVPTEDGLAETAGWYRKHGWL